MGDDWFDCDDPPDEDMEIDVCQHCGRYFAWTAALRDAWQKHWRPQPGAVQPQRCFRCITDETWIEQ